MVVSHRVVDRLEVVDVDQHHAEGRAAPAVAGELEVEPVPELPVVHEAGQAISDRLVSLPLVAQGVGEGARGAARKGVH